MLSHLSRVLPRTLASLSIVEVLQLTCQDITHETSRNDKDTIFWMLYSAGQLFHYSPNEEQLEELWTCRRIEKPNSLPPCLAHASTSLSIYTLYYVRIWCLELYSFSSQSLDDYAHVCQSVSNLLQVTFQLFLCLLISSSPQGTGPWTNETTPLIPKPAVSTSYCLGCLETTQKNNWKVYSPTDNGSVQRLAFAKKSPTLFFRPLTVVFTVSFLIKSGFRCAASADAKSVTEEQSWIIAIKESSTRRKTCTKRVDHTELGGVWTLEAYLFKWLMPKRSKSHKALEMYIYIIWLMKWKVLDDPPTLQATTRKRATSVIEKHPWGDAASWKYWPKDSKNRPHQWNSSPHRLLPLLERPRNVETPCARP